MMLNKKIDQLEKWFQSVEGTITAFSGGIDSSLVLFLSRKFLSKEKAIGCISISPSLKRKDYDLAKSFCQTYDIHLEVIETQEIKDENYFSNPSNRCFFCKSHLYQDLQEVCNKYPNFIVLNGTNRDDFGDYRPGLQAARNYEVKSPLADCQLSKAYIRSLAQHFGLPNWNKPASPCLSSRVPYGQQITIEKLQQIEAAEDILNTYGFEDVRVRHYHNTAKVEVPVHQLETLRLHFGEISPAILALGFQHCTIDEEGLISGKLNRSLQS